jgi:hypothetical protein
MYACTSHDSTGALGKNSIQPNCKQHYSEHLPAAELRVQYHRYVFAYHAHNAHLVLTRDNDLVFSTTRSACMMICVGFSMTELVHPSSELVNVFCYCNVAALLAYTHAAAEPCQLLPVPSHAAARAVMSATQARSTMQAHLVFISISFASFCARSRPQSTTFRLSHLDPLRQTWPWHQGVTRRSLQHLLCLWPWSTASQLVSATRGRA